MSFFDTYSIPWCLHICLKWSRPNKQSFLR